MDSTRILRIHFSMILRVTLQEIDQMSRQYARGDLNLVECEIIKNRKRGTCARIDFQDQLA